MAECYGHVWGRAALHLECVPLVSHQLRSVQSNLDITIGSGPPIFNDTARLSLYFGGDRGLGPEISNDTARLLYGGHGTIVIREYRYIEV